MKNIKKNLDLNLLRVLSAILQSGSTLKAAETLGVSQPAISRSLAKLRSHFNDQLFIRTKSGLSPTARATQIGNSLPFLLSSIDEAIYHENFFNPNIEIFHLVVSEFFDENFFSSLMEELKLKAPETKLVITDWTDSTFDELINNKIDLAFGFFPLKSSKEIRQTKLFECDYVYLVRDEHPIKDSCISIDELKKWNLLIMNNSENLEFKRVEDELKNNGHVFTVPIRSSRLVSILQQLSTQDYVFPCPDYIYSSIRNFSKLNLRKILMSPVNYTAKCTLGCYYSERNRNNKKIIFLENCIKSTLKNYLKNEKPPKNETEI
ncbi:LysR family transcriptional regulator [Vibrio mimicus]